MKFFWFFVAAIVLVACSASPTPAVVTSGGQTPQAVATTLPGGYPAPATPDVSLATAYPNQVEDDFKPGPTVTLNPELGIVKGVLKHQGKPVSGADLYIADLLKSEDGKDVAYRFSQTDSVRSATNENGEFEFRNVPHGAHGLILDQVVQSYLLLKPNTQEAMKFDIGPGTVIDLGVLDYDELPIQ